MALGRIISFVIIATAAVSNSFAQAGSDGHPFTITISADHGIIRVGDEARVHVVLTNISDQDLVVRRSVDPYSAEQHYTIRVRDKDQKDAPETEYGRRAMQRQLIGSDSAKILKPGEKLEEDTVLSRVFGLTSPGEYGVQFLRPVSDNPKAEVVKSNTITITVVPRDSSDAKQR